MALFTPTKPKRNWTESKKHNTLILNLWSQSSFVHDFSYEVQVVGVCFFAYSSRTDISICTKLGMHISWDEEKTIPSLKLRKSVLGSISTDGISCSIPIKDGFSRSDNKYDRRKAPKTNTYRRLASDTVPANRRRAYGDSESQNLVKNSIWMA